MKEIRRRQKHLTITTYNSRLLEVITSKRSQKRLAAFTLLFMMFQILSPFSFIKQKVASAAVLSAVAVTTSIDGSTVSGQTFTRIVGQGSGTFTAALTGGVAPFHYVWKKGTTVVGGDFSTYFMNDLVLGDAGSYTVTVTDSDTVPSVMTSAAINFVVTIDTTAPSTSSPQLITGTAAPVITPWITATDGESGISKVEFLVDAVLAGTDTEPYQTNQYGYNWNTMDKTPGTYAFTAKAYNGHDTATTPVALGSATIYSMTPAVNDSQMGSIYYQLYEGTPQQQTIPATTSSFATGYEIHLFAQPALGYHLASWTGDCSGFGSNNWPAITMATANLACTAVFEANPGGTPVTHTVTFDKNDNAATGTMADQTITEGEAANLTANSFVNTGFTFSGWATSSSGSVAYIDSASYTMGTVNVTLYAKWAEPSSTHTVTFDSNGGSPTPTAQTVDTETPATEPTAPTRTGYNLVGWTTTLDGSTFWNFADPVSADMTLYAKWTAAVVVEGEHDITAVGVPFHLYGGNSVIITAVGALPAGVTWIDFTVTDSYEDHGFVGVTGLDHMLFNRNITAVTNLGPLTDLSPGTFRITLSDSLAAASDRVYWWNGSTWSQEGITNQVVNETAETISFTTTHLSEFGVFWSEVGPGGDGNTDGTPKGGTTLPVTGSSIVNLLLNMLLAGITLFGMVLLTRRSRKLSRLAFILN